MLSNKVILFALWGKNHLVINVFVTPNRTPCVYSGTAPVTMLWFLRLESVKTPLKPIKGALICNAGFHVMLYRLLCSSTASVPMYFIRITFCTSLSPLHTYSRLLTFNTWSMPCSITEPLLANLQYNTILISIQWFWINQDLNTICIMISSGLQTL